MNNSGSKTDEIGVKGFGSNQRLFSDAGTLMYRGTAGKHSTIENLELLSAAPLPVCNPTGTKSDRALGGGTPLRIQTYRVRNPRPTKEQKIENTDGNPYLIEPDVFSYEVRPSMNLFSRSMPIKSTNKWVVSEKRLSNEGMKRWGFRVMNMIKSAKGNDGNGGSDDNDAYKKRIKNSMMGLRPELFQRRSDAAGIVSMNYAVSIAMVVCCKLPSKAAKQQSASNLMKQCSHAEVISIGTRSHVFDARMVYSMMVGMMDNLGDKVSRVFPLNYATNMRSALGQGHHWSTAVKQDSDYVRRLTRIIGRY